MPQNNIVFLDSTRLNAPVLTGQVNTLNALLYQVLCTGFNSQTLTGCTRSGGVVTCTKTAHGFRTYDWVLRAGADPTDYNGMVQVTGYTADTFTHAIATTPGAINTLGTAAFAPLGWTRDYNSGNKSVYHGDDQSSLLPLYVDDSGAIGSQSYRVTWFNGFESWNSGVGSNPWPTVAQQANGLCWNKSTTLDGTGRPWWFWGNGRRFLMGIRWHPTYTFYDVFGYGDYLPTIPGNAFPGFIIGATADTQTSPGIANYFNVLRNLGSVPATAPAGYGEYLCRKFDGSGSAITFGLKGDNSIQTYMGYGGLPAANPATSGYEIVPIDIHSGASLATASYYSKLPGAYQLLHDQLFTHGDFLPEMPDLPGRRLIVLDIPSGASSNYRGKLILDTTGPL